ncbi:helix-turn-helix domain-containing protein [Halomonas halmophila]|uniref:IclR family transcriptional regulator n=1 Tax=Halomonas halmophila TaxID=252 RepID=A0A4Y4EVI4_9GAMM|nr:helix-turn-helix domain-containing protein [Halomonas halmophila]GED21912.1 IclR family transcriptional regulator [Halomonas halmophila]
MAQDRVEAVERALRILEAFDSSQEHFTLAELAQATGYYKSTLLRLLGSLERHDYVQRGDDSRWRLGGSPSRLARRHAPSQWLATRLQPLLDRMASETGETAALLEVQAGCVECRLVALPDNALRHELRPGQRWTSASTEDPRPALPGGTMGYRALETPAATPLHWLTLSGPASRLTPSRAGRCLDKALATLRPSEEMTT